MSKVTIPNSVTYIGDSAFENCTALTEVSLGSGVKVIYNKVFSGSGLQSITIPATVTEIRMDAFSNCRSLTQITFKGTAPNMTGYLSGTNRIYAYTEVTTGWNASTMHNYSGDIVWMNGPAPTITANPEDYIAREEAPASFVVRASGLNSDDTLSYQWYMSKNSGQNWEKVTSDPNITGEQKWPLRLGPDYDKKDGTMFRCRVFAKNGKEKTAILWAVKNNITSGTTSATFSPSQKCKCYQIVTFLYKYNNL